MMHIMASWVTLDDLEGANTKRNYKNRDGESLVKNPNIGSRLDCTFATIIRYTTTKIVDTILYHWRGHGLTIFFRIVTLHDTLP